MSQDWSNLTVNKDIISFGMQRIPTRNVASLSIVEDPVNRRKVEIPPSEGWKSVGYILIGAAAIPAWILIKNIDRVFPLPFIFAVVILLALSKECFKSTTHDEQLYQVNLLTNGGSITALTGLTRQFANDVIEALQGAVSGNDHRPIYVDARSQDVKVGSVDMSQKTYSATNSPGSVVGDNTNSNITTNVTQGVQDVEKLMARVGELAADDKGELLKLLIEIRAYLADGSVSKQQASASYNAFLGRIGKYFSIASDLVSLVAAIGKFF